MASGQSDTTHRSSQANPNPGANVSASDPVSSASTNVPPSSSRTNLPIPAQQSQAPAATQTTSTSPQPSSSTASLTSFLPRSSANPSGSSTPTNPARSTSANSGLASSSTMSPRRTPAVPPAPPPPPPSNLSATHQSASTSFSNSNNNNSNNSSSTSTGSRRLPSAAVSLSNATNINSAPSLFGYYSHDPPNQGHGQTQPPSSQTSAPSRTQTQTPSTAYSPSYWRSAPPPHPRASSHQYHGTPEHSGRGGSFSTSSPRIAASGLYSSSTTSRSSNFYSASQSTAGHSSGGPSLGGFDTPTWSGVTSSSSRLANTFEENSVISLTWTIRDAHLLRDEVERSPPPSEGGRSVSAGAGKSEVWTTQPLFGDGKWKLELVRTSRPISQEQTNETVTTEDEEREPGSDRGDVSSDPQDQGTSRRRPTSITVLSVYLTSTIMDYSSSEVEIPASIMLGIRPARDPIGCRGSRSGGWTWRHFDRFTFRREQEYYECHSLPSLSELLLQDAIRKDDAFCVTVQLATGRSNAGGQDLASVTNPPFEMEGINHVPRSVIDSLDGLLDCSNTGDVRIIVRERGLLPVSFENQAQHRQLDLRSYDQEVRPYPVGSQKPVESAEAGVLVRDRVIWCHSSILRNRSEYFKTMLSSEFSEGQGQAFSDHVYAEDQRVVRTLRIPDADYTTAYWLIRYMYTEEIRFLDEEDVRSAALDDEWVVSHPYLAGTDESESFTSLGHHYVWSWSPISELEQQDQEEGGGDPPSSAKASASTSSPALQHPSSSAFSFGPYTSHGRPCQTPGGGQVRQRDSSGSLHHQATPPNACTSRNQNLTEVAAPGSMYNSNQAGMVVPASPGSSRRGPHESGQNASSSPYHSRSGTWEQRHGSNQNPEQLQKQHVVSKSSEEIRQDPHPHPTQAPPPPASALAIYKIAHRYHLSALSQLAQAHMIASLSPSSAFAVLLATSLYSELHAKVKGYVYENWEAVSSTEEFERCCDEFSAGEWGLEAGKAMRIFMRSLVSPARLVAQGGGR
ncbi:hypothetical protein IE53DRAFT_389208 [Violaceomyces palustris]|uniref:Uncharacterized protein n=1 Tax=Violaceomyces palustris TaxID=1673888 RepID=A0ACD0NRY0_9BASI|nr:hypothetical protein IE53DRAFT_389208 [Violaceomyces palustris]